MLALFLALCKYQTTAETVCCLNIKGRWIVPSQDMVAPWTCIHVLRPQPDQVWQMLGRWHCLLTAD